MMIHSSGPRSDFIRQLLDDGARMAVDPRVLRLLRVERIRAERERQRHELQRMLDRLHNEDNTLW